MGKLFRVLETIEFVAIGLVTASRFVFGVLIADPITAIMALIVGLIAVLFALPLYVLGNMVDEVKELRQAIYTLAAANKEAVNKHLLNSNGWKCSCGRINADYISTCACGKNRHEAE